MATLVANPLSRSGVDLTTLAAAAGGGDAFASTGKEFFVIKNGDGSDHTVTFTIQQQVDGVTPTPVAHTVTAGHTKMFGPFPTGIYNDTNGLTQITYSAVTTVTVGVYSLPAAG